MVDTLHVMVLIRTKDYLRILKGASVVMPPMYAVIGKVESSVRWPHQLSLSCHTKVGPPVPESYQTDDWREKVPPRLLELSDHGYHSLLLTVLPRLAIGYLS